MAKHHHRRKAARYVVAYVGIATLMMACAIYLIDSFLL